MAAAFLAAGDLIVTVSHFEPKPEERARIEAEGGVVPVPDHVVKVSDTWSGASAFHRLHEAAAIELFGAFCVLESPLETKASRELWKEHFPQPDFNP